MIYCVLAQQDQRVLHISHGIIGLLNPFYIPWYCMECNTWKLLYLNRPCCEAIECIINSTVANVKAHQLQYIAIMLDGEK